MGKTVEPHVRSILRIKIKPQENWDKRLLLVSQIDLPIETVNKLEDINLEQAIWFCKYQFLEGPSIAEFEDAVGNS